LIDPVADLALRASLALLLATSALAKLRDLTSFDAAVAGYELLPERLARPAARVFVALELALAPALLWSGVRVAAACVVAALLSLYTVGIAVNLARGRRDIDCGCGGPAGGQAISGSLLVRNGVLVAAALACSLPRVARAWSPLDFFTLLAAVATGALLYAASNTLLRSWAPR